MRLSLALWLVLSTFACRDDARSPPKQDSRTKYVFDMSGSEFGTVVEFDGTEIIEGALEGDELARQELRQLMVGDDGVLALSVCENAPAAALAPLVDSELLEALRPSPDRIETLWSRSRSLPTGPQRTLANAVLNLEPYSRYAWDAADYLCRQGDTLRCGARESLKSTYCIENRKDGGLGFGLGEDRVVAVVCQDSVASRRGLKIGDRIDRVGPYPLEEQKNLQSLFLIHQTLTVTREGQRVDIDLSR